MTFAWPDPVPAPPVGATGRFGGRWRFIGAGLSNVWRYGDLELSAPSGRLLLRGPNGTGKTTALEALFPYLLDLNPQRLGAGRSRNTSLSGLMKIAADGKRCLGYLWMSFASPGEETEVVSYGVRLHYSPHSNPAVAVHPFWVPGRPLHDLALWGPGRAALGNDEWRAAVEAAGGDCFPDPDTYVRDLGARLFGVEPAGVAELAARIRNVRNPALLADVSPREAADALAESLPGVDAEVIARTGEALAASASTREAFEADRLAADALADFARVWTNHAVDVAADAAATAASARNQLSHLRSVRTTAERKAQEAAAKSTASDLHLEGVQAALRAARAKVQALEESDDYRNHRQLSALAEQVKALSGAAESNLSALRGAAREESRLLDEYAGQLSRLAADIDSVAAEARDAAPTVTRPSAPSASRPARQDLRVGPAVVARSAGLVVEDRAEQLSEAAAQWQSHAEGLQRLAARAALHAANYEPVRKARSQADAARGEAARLNRSADEADRVAAERAGEAADEAARLAGPVRAWAAGGPGDPELDPAWFDDVAWDEPATVLEVLEEAAGQAGRWAAEQTAAARQEARAAQEAAVAAEGQAADLRAEAARIRDGDVLLPLPRPEWAGPGDDTIAFGAAVEWGDVPDEATRDRIEAVLAAAGVLGAALSQAGASTTAWSVTADGPVVTPNLASMLTADQAHPLGPVAAAVLERIALVERLGDSDSTGLVVATDGSFRAGVMTAVVPEAVDDSRRPEARHIGARRRRDAALAHAASLDAQADVLDAEAQEHWGRADVWQNRADAVAGHAKAFPAVTALRSSVAAQAVAAAAAETARVRAAEADTKADRAEDTAALASSKWGEEVAADGLVADVDQLHAGAARDRQAAGTLSGLTRRLSERLLPELARLVGRVGAFLADETVDETLGAARASHDAADEQAQLLEQRREAAGVTAGQVEQKLIEARAEVEKLKGAEMAAERAARQDANEAVRAEEKAVQAAQNATAAEPAATEAIAALRRLLAVPGVAEAVLAGEPETSDVALPAQVVAATDGRPTATRRSVRDKADEARAALAGVWFLDPGVDHPALESYSLTFKESLYTPIGAAREAAALAARAEQNLRAAEEQALTEFVIGQLPRAIAQAWTRLQDWKREVNAKMRTAAASSGLTVAVSMEVDRKELSAAQLTVYDEVCRSGAALRPGPERQAVGDALFSLISASPEDSMVAKVADAVDIAAWVKIHYEVTRAGEEPARWGSRTPLSSGERRLVVLAPMLAAVAALYDRLPAGAPRLAALDEIPAEVDEHGREGLARFIAELDLDLIATSYLWDGAPGAWDGIDAWDLEAAAGAVVAFPMLVRGELPLPNEATVGL